MGKDPRNPTLDIDTLFKTKCGHRFHKECLLPWLEDKGECPVCREPLQPYINYDDI